MRTSQQNPRRIHRTNTRKCYIPQSSRRWTWRELTSCVPRKWPLRDPIWSPWRWSTPWRWALTTPMPNSAHLSSSNTRITAYSSPLRTSKAKDFISSATFRNRCKDDFQLYRFIIQSSRTLSLAHDNPEAGDSGEKMGGIWSACCSLSAGDYYNQQELCKHRVSLIRRLCIIICLLQ